MKTSEPGTLPLTCSLKTGHKTTAATLLALLALAFLSVNASAQTRNWNVLSGTWNDPSSWLENAVPTSTDTALIDNGGTALLPTGVSGTTGTITISGSAGTGALSITGGVLNVSQNNFSAKIGNGPSSSGTATVSSGTWNNNGILEVGVSGTGTLNISGGSVINAGQGYIASEAGSNGTATVSSGTWSFTGSPGTSYIVVGRKGTGTLNVSGGLVSNNSLVWIGYLPGSEGTATVSSGTWSNDGYLAVGYAGGTGTLNVSGGFVSNSYAIIGNVAASEGTVTVSSGTWSNTGFIAVGLSGTGALNVTGGFVSDTDGYIGVNAGSEGTATVSGGTWSNSGTLFVGGYVDLTGTFTGTGELNLTDTGNVTVGSGTGTVRIADGAGSSGTLNIGTGGTAGMLNAAAVNGGFGAGTLNFNHTGTHTFAATLTGSLAVNKLASGTTILTAANSYAGPTNINAGTLLLSGSGSTGTGTTTVSSSATLGGDGTVQGDLVIQSSGTVAPGLSPGILSVNGNAGFNGDAALSIELGGTVKGQDRLAVSGTTTLSASPRLELAFLGETNPDNLITSGTYTILNSSMLTGTFASATDLGVYDDGGGVTYTANSVNLVLTLNLLGGDADLNGITNGLDLNILGGNWLGSGNWNGGDFNGDGVVNGLDLNILGGKWLMSATVSGSGGGSGGRVSAIPEPGSGAFLVLGGAALISRRRRAAGQT